MKKIIRILCWGLFSVCVFSSVAALLMKDYLGHFSMAWFGFIAFTWAVGKKMNRKLAHLTFACIVIYEAVHIYPMPESANIPFVLGKLLGLFLSTALWINYHKMNRLRDQET